MALALALRLFETPALRTRPRGHARITPPPDPNLPRYEFVAYMLAQLGRTPAADIDRIMEMFDELDRDTSGSLDRNDIRAHVSRKQGSRLSAEVNNSFGIDWTGPQPHDPSYI